MPKQGLPVNTMPPGETGGLYFIKLFLFRGCAAILTYTVMHVFCGSGGGALGFQKATSEYKGMVGKFRTLCGIDVDREACADFETLTGARAVRLDLFPRQDYIAFHGHEPPEDWREATTGDLLEATGGECPDVIFSSPPCKGMSGLLPSNKAKSMKYQALNKLVVHGLKLCLEAFEDNLPAVVMLENVPRITSRGKVLLEQLIRTLKGYGFETDGRYHDCGEIGGLGQHRKRYLLIARNTNKMSNIIFKPPRRRVHSIGDVLEKLPLPDEPAMGPMHRLPRLQWKTWMRLALIPAGGDWRDLENVPYKELRLKHIPRDGVYQVARWDEPCRAIVGHARPSGSNGVAAIADPRPICKSRPSLYGVANWVRPISTIIGTASVSSSNGVAAVADPRLNPRSRRHPGVYQIIKWDDSSPCVTGTRFGSGAPAIADPCTRFKPSTHTAIYSVCSFDEPARTVTGVLRPNNGAISIADPRTTCKVRNGVYGIMAWDQPATTVIGSADVHAGTSAVADPRIPKENEQGVWMIIALDGTWHRPLTTLELAALQGFPMTMPNGNPLKLAGNSDARWRERIGNAVPPPAAQAMAEQILNALLVSEKGDWKLGSTGIWVKNSIRQIPFEESYIVERKTMP